MALVEGDYCSEVKQTCEKSWYDKANRKTVCERFALTVQDRVIRNEMRVRLREVLPPATAPRTTTITTGRPRPTRARGSTARRSGSCSSSSPR